MQTEMREKLSVQVHRFMDSVELPSRAKMRVEVTFDDDTVPIVIEGTTESGHGFTEAQLAEGAHVLSEILNDNAPIGERTHLVALRQALGTMRKTPPNQDVRRLF